MRPLVVLATLAAVGSLAACGSTTPPTPPPVTVTVQAPPAPTPATSPPATLRNESVSSRRSSATTWKMPNLVGSNLQDAQNAIQSLTGFEIAVTTSHDQTGARRRQVLDRNWKVCTQNIPPGKTITTTSKIDFGAVKLEESC